MSDSLDQAMYGALPLGRWDQSSHATLCRNFADQRFTVLTLNTDTLLFRVSTYSSRYSYV